MLTIIPQERPLDVGRKTSVNVVFGIRNDFPVGIKNLKVAVKIWAAFDVHPDKEVPTPDGFTLGEPELAPLDGGVLQAGNKVDSTVKITTNNPPREKEVGNGLSWAYNYTLKASVSYELIDALPPYEGSAYTFQIAF